MEHQYQYPTVKEIPTLRAPVDRDTFLDGLGVESALKPKVIEAIGVVAVELTLAA